MNRDTDRLAQMRQDHEEQLARDRRQQRVIQRIVWVAVPLILVLAVVAVLWSFKLAAALLRYLEAVTAAAS